MCATDLRKVYQKRGALLVVGLGNPRPRLIALEVGQTCKRKRKLRRWSTGCSCSWTWTRRQVLPSIGPNIGVIIYFSARNLCSHSKWLNIGQIPDVQKQNNVTTPIFGQMYGRTVLRVLIRLGIWRVHQKGPIFGAPSQLQDLLY